MKLLRSLIIYYGIVQVAHMVMNIWVLINPDLIMLASPLLENNDTTALYVSLFLDLLIASPVGIVGVLYYFSPHHRDMARTLLFISLTTAIVSAVVYVGALVFAGAFVLSAVNIVFGIVFIPILVLFGMLCYYREN